MNSIRHKAAGILIAGPCSAESEGQVLKTARALAEIGGITAFRCGLWKPRTRPGDFEGAGDRGLMWLKRVKEETGLPLAVEVATPAHAEACLEFGIDMLWIGSRTVVNPFSVQELATALKGVDMPVLVKNPVNPDLMLWAGAIERLLKQGVGSVLAVHRGFSVPGPGIFRNEPLWPIALELMQLFPGIGLLSDPSHICGSRDLVPQMSQMAMGLGFDGLMIEVHENPEEALTDREQQISPEELERLLERLANRQGSGQEEQMAAWRGEIDRLDGLLIEVLAKRMAAAEKIGFIKKTAGRDIHDPERWNALLSDRLKKAEAAGLDPELIRTLLDEIHIYSKKRQERND